MISDDEVYEQTPPWHLWVVGVLTLLFTLLGAYDFVMSQSANRAYIEAMVAPQGITADVALAHFTGFPLWADLAWAVGVGAGVGGALLLLLRRALAYPALLASLAGLLVTNAYAAAHPVPGLTDTSASYATVAIVFMLMLAVTLYARAQRKAGVLG